ncbi:hypothetical protein [Sanguibacter sp. 25GB23B1]|uniref:restriction system modified-DNA reader domain-containing protein n=1 Tax=unclassified Sanguibacter TaxID=2645534 RepID=UPI0032AEE5DC
MPLFDVGSERSPLVVLARPEESAFDADARTVVQEHLSALLGERAFTVTGMTGHHRSTESVGAWEIGSASQDADVPVSTLALDSSGTSVVVVVAPTLDERGLAAALGTAGRASRLTRTELADLYPAGAERFHKDVTDFYDALPATLPTARSARARGVAVRLVVVCADVTPDVRDALAFLSTAGPTVEVFRVGVLPASPGRRLLDVSPLVATGPATPPAGAPPAGTASAGLSESSFPAAGPDLSAPFSALGRVRGGSRRAVERALTGPVVAVPVGRVSVPAPVGPAPVVPAPTGPVRTSAFGPSSFPPVPSAPSAGDMTTILPPVRATDYPVYSEPPVEQSEPTEERAAHPDDRASSSDGWSAQEDAWTAPPRRSATGHSPLSAPLPVVDLPPPGTPYTPIFLSVPDMLANLPERPSGLPVPDAGPRTALDLAAEPADDSGYVAGPGEAAAWEGAGTGLTGRSAYRASAFIAAKKYIPEKLDRAPGRAPAAVLDREHEAVGAARAPGARGAGTANPAEHTSERPDQHGVVRRGPLSIDDSLSFDGPSSLSFDGSSSPFWADLSAQFAEPVRFDPPDPPDLPDPSDLPDPPVQQDPPGPAAREDVSIGGGVHGPTDDALGELASALHEALPLVWVRHRRGERFEALLHPDGTLETSDGERYADPSWAANVVSGSAAADGWRVWRAGESGPTLAELLG